MKTKDSIIGYLVPPAGLGAVQGIDHLNFETAVDLTIKLVLFFISIAPPALKFLHYIKNLSKNRSSNNQNNEL